MTEAGNMKGRSGGDRSIVSAANAKNGKSQESSFFPATFRHFLFVKLYVFPSERNCWWQSDQVQMPVPV